MWTVDCLGDLNAAMHEWLRPVHVAIRTIRIETLVPVSGENFVVLSICNRTENWKTARSFAPLLGEGAVHLANRLSPDPKWNSAQVKLELYWKGMRDHFAQCVATRETKERDVQALYKKRFGGLQKQVQHYVEQKRFQPLKPCNYNGAEAKRLFDNLYNTEIDIVLETPEHLFIGEAKHETGFHASSKLVLVHQLIRQYVMATILVDLRNDVRTVVPFVVTDAKRARTTKKLPSQLEFLMERNWLKKCCVLTWCDIKKLASR